MELTKNDYNYIREYIYSICGINLDDDKEYLIHQRLEPVAETQGCRNFTEFAILLRTYSNQGLRDQVVTAITTNETSFFRDTHPFEMFRSVIMPRLKELAISRKKRPFDRKGAKVSILSAGSSTGQEPYSLSILIHEYLQLNPDNELTSKNFEIVATDLSSRALGKAITGEYNDLEMSRGLSDLQKALYFNRVGDSWAIKDYIREIIEFRRVNLIEPFMYLGGFDLIFCRNVLIYFDINTRQKIFEQFHSMLSDNGILVLGATENLYGICDKFESHHAGAAVYYEKIKN